MSAGEKGIFVMLWWNRSEEPGCDGFCWRNQSTMTAEGNRGQRTQRLWVLPKTQNSHTAHKSTTSQYTHTNLYKSWKHALQQDGVNRRRHSSLPTRPLWDPLWSMPLPYGRLFHPRLALTNCKSCRTQQWELPQDEHKTQTYNICMTKHSHFPYTSTYSSTPHNTYRKNYIHHIHYTNTRHTSTLQG